MAMDVAALIDPARFRDPLSLGDRAGEALLGFLRRMLLIRAAEEAVGELVRSGEARCPCHLAIGQEAAAVGVAAHLDAGDRAFGAHRSHAQYLAMGGDVGALLAEVLGKASGCSRGMGGSMHLFASEVGFHGSVPIVAGTVPVAVGAALAARKDGRGAVAVAFFGDGAAEEGGVQESLNLAAVMKLPVLFVCENNLYASHMDIRLRQPSERVSRYADAHHVPARLVDGNDVLAVADAADELIAAARSGGGPGFLEAVTYRWRGHVGPDENIDVGLRRRVADLEAWKRRDPIRRLADALTARGDLDQTGLAALRTDAKEVVRAALAAARQAPYPPESALLDLVYAEAR